MNGDERGSSRRLNVGLRELGTRFGWFDAPIEKIIRKLTKEIEEQYDYSDDYSSSHTRNITRVEETRNTCYYNYCESAKTEVSGIGEKLDTADQPIVLDVSSSDDSDAQELGNIVISDTEASPAGDLDDAFDMPPKSLRERMLKKYDAEKSTGSDSDDLDSFLNKVRTPKPDLCLSTTPKDDKTASGLTTRNVRSSLDDFIVREDGLSEEETEDVENEDDVFMACENKENEFIQYTWMVATPRISREMGSVPKHRETTGISTLTSSKAWRSPAFTGITKRHAATDLPKRPRSVLGSIITPYSMPKEFRKNKDTLVKDLFQLYNSTVFENKLPSDFNITWNNKMRSTAGFCYYARKFGVNTARIELAEKVIDSADRLRDTLIHEMCHAAAWVISSVRAGHGPVWKKWALKANVVLQDLPPISRCHSYKINAKFTYRCTNEFCSNSFGRHSKSVDLEKQRCAYCRSEHSPVIGQWQMALRHFPGYGSRLELQPQLKKDGTPQTTRALSKFALFVKENYSKVRKQGMAHKDVMRELSSQFGALSTK